MIVMNTSKASLIIGTPKNFFLAIEIVSRYPYCRIIPLNHRAVILNSKKLMTWVEIALG